MGVFTIQRQVSVQLNLLYQAAAETQAWINAVAAAGGSVSQARSSIVDSLIAGLKIDGVWTKLDRLWLFAAENSQSALVDLKAQASASPVNSPTFYADGGYKGNGTTSYVNSNYNPSVGGLNFTLNANHLGSWVANIGLIDSSAAVGSYDGTNAIYIQWSASGPNWQLANNIGSAFAITSAPGHIINIRTASNSIFGSVNGVATSTNPQSSVAIPNLNLAADVLTRTASPTNYGTHQIAAMHAGGTLTATDAANFYSRLNTYMNAIQMDSAAWVAAVVAAGGTVSATRRTLINGLINGLKLDGIWGKLDRLWVHAAENTQSALIDLVNLQTATAVNSPTFTVDGGYTGNGTSSYVNSNYNPSVGGQNITLNTNHLGCWVVTVGEADGTTAVGVSDGTNQLAIYWQSSGPNWAFGNNAGSVFSGGGGAPGHLINDRTSSSSYTGYLNGVSVGVGGASAATVNFNICIDARGASTPFAFGTHQIAATHAGGALTATDAANFYARLRGYFDSIQMDSAAWVAAVVGAGGSVSSTRRALVNDLIRGLKTDGIWIKLDRLWLFAAENSQSALVDLVANAGATATNSPTFTADRGYAGNGTNSYVNSNLATNAAINFQQNSAAIFGWTSAGTDQGAVVGLPSTVDRTRIIPNAGGVQLLYACNSNGNDGGGLSVQFNAGLFLATRTASNAIRLDWSGVQQHSGTTVSVARLAENLVTHQDGGTNWSTRQISVFGLGGAFTATDSVNFYSRLSTYMGAVFANAWATAVVGAGGTVSAARQTLVTQLIQGLMQDGVWSKLDRLWLFAAENSQSALVDLVRGSSATATNSPTFTANQGYTGNGSNAYVDTGLNASTATGINFVQNSAHLSCWNLTVAGQGGDICGIVGQGSQVTGIQPRFTDNNCYYGINGSGGSSFANATGGGPGLYMATRTGSTAQRIDLNGAQLNSNSNASVAPDNSNFTALRSSTTYSARQVASLGVGGALTAGDSTNLYLRLRTYMMALGIANPGFDTATTSWVSAVTTAGGTVSAARQLLIDNLIQGLKADGVWAKLDRLWIFAAENSQSALIDLVGLTTASAVSSPTFTVDRGYNGNGSTSYINTNFNPATQGVNYTLNAASIGAYNRTARDPTTGGSNLQFMGASVSGNPTIGLYLDNTPTVAVVINSASNSQSSQVSASTQGFFVGVRPSSTTHVAYKNGVSVGTSSISSTSVPSLNVFVCGRSFNGSLDFPCSDQFAAAFLGGALTDNDVRNFSKRLSLYMQTVGASVY